jgi:hypothetical protein
VAIADIEYDWRETHGDPGATADALTLGWSSGRTGSSTGVLGEPLRQDNGFGILGMADGARPSWRRRSPTSTSATSRR